MKYQFTCKACDKKFTLELSIEKYSTLKRFICPHCESDKVVRVISTPMIIFKGDGFYITDSREE